MHFNLRGTNTESFYGLPPIGRRCEMAEVSLSTFVGNTWREGWVLADGVGYSCSSMRSTCCGAALQAVEVIESRNLSR